MKAGWLREGQFVTDEVCLARGGSSCDAASRPCVPSERDFAKLETDARDTRATGSEGFRVRRRIKGKRIWLMKTLILLSLTIAVVGLAASARARGGAGHAAGYASYPGHAAPVYVAPTVAYAPPVVYRPVVVYRGGYGGHGYYPVYHSPAYHAPVVHGFVGTGYRGGGHYGGFHGR